MDDRRSARLHVTWDGGETIATADESPILAGRGAEARVRLANRTVSRRHLRLVVENGTWVAVDQSSRGTYHADGTRITRVAVGRDEVELHLASPDGPALRLVAVSAVPDGPSSPPYVAPAEGAIGATAAAVPMTVGDLTAGLVDLTRRWTRRRVLASVATVVVAAAVSYAVNLWVVARHYGGPTYVPAGAPVTVGPDRTQALVLWFLAAAIGSAMVTQLVVLGPRAFADKVTSFPARLRAIPAGIDQSWVLVAMVGTAVALLVGGLMIPALRGALGLGILLFLPFAIGRVVMAAASPLVVAVTAGTGRSTSDGGAVAGTGLVGAGAGLAIGYVLSSLLVRLLLAVALMVMVVVHSRRASPALTLLTLFVVLAGGLVIVDWITSGAAHADDGGWIECGSNWSDFTGCAGTDPAFDGARDGGIAGACGGACGNVLGGSDGGKPPPVDAPCAV